VVAGPGGAGNVCRALLMTHGRGVLFAVRFR
jgi:hypothetical protein